MPVETAARIWDAEQQAEGSRWPGLSTLECIESERQELGKAERINQRCFLASDTLTAAQAGAAARAHWGAESGLHGRLDVLLGEDASRVRTEHAPENFSLLRKIAVNAIKADSSKGSIIPPHTPQRRRDTSVHPKETTPKNTEAALTVAVDAMPLRRPCCPGGHTNPYHRFAGG